MTCARGHEVKPMKSAAGWYMGTMTEEGPYFRITNRYYSTKEEAEKNLIYDYRLASENMFCSNGRLCIDIPE